MTWPYWLSDNQGMKLINLARASLGNGIISRKIIQAVCDQLRSRDSDEILVGVMWSGNDRHDFYHSTAHAMVDANRRADVQWVQNPARLTDASAESGWVICNTHWQDEINLLYYRYFHDPVGSIIYTIEHILRTQWFLEKNNIEYFMTTYTDSVLPVGSLEHPEIKYLYQQIDLDKFLPITGLEQWCRSNTDIPFRKDDRHPTGDHHRRFVNDVVVPYLDQRGVTC